MHFKLSHQTSGGRWSQFPSKAITIKISLKEEETSHEDEREGKESVDGVSDRGSWQLGIRSVDIYCYTGPAPAQRILTKAHKYASPWGRRRGRWGN